MGYPKLEKEMASICAKGGLQNLFADRVLKMASDWEDKKRWDMEEWEDLDECTKGLGSKCSTVLMALWHGKNIGMSVDTHVEFIANASSVCNTEDQEKIRLKLQDIIPSEKWSNFNNACGGLCQALFSMGARNKQWTIDAATKLGRGHLDMVNLLLYKKRLDRLETSYRAIKTYGEMMVDDMDMDG